MTWMPADRWPERREPVRLLLRFVGVAALCYVLAVSGGFSHSIFTGVLSVLAVGTLLITLVDRGVTGWWDVVAAAVLTIAGSLLNLEAGPMGWVVFGIGCVRLIGRPRVGLRIAIPVCAAAAIILVVIDAQARDNWLSSAWTALGTLGVGSFAFTRRQNLQRREQERELVERSRELEQRSLELIEQTHKTQAETARVAALEERSRIARDIHDVLAHSLGGLVVQLDAADAVLQADGDPRDVAARIQASRRLAVDGLHEARNAVRELGRQDRIEEQPATDLAERLRAIVDGPVGRHLKIDFDVLGDSRPVPGAVGTAFGAITREALTNINKHAPGAPAAATLLYGPEQIRLEIINGLAAAPAGTGTAPDGADSPSDRSRTPPDTDLATSGAGLGLTGMARRMAEIGGGLQAGPAGQRWQLMAAWPVPTVGPGDRADPGSPEVPSRDDPQDRGREV